MHDPDSGGKGRRFKSSHPDQICGYLHAQIKSVGKRHQFIRRCLAAVFLSVGCSDSKNGYRLERPQQENTHRVRPRALVRARSLDGAKLALCLGPSRPLTPTINATSFSLALPISLSDNPFTATVNTVRTNSEDSLWRRRLRSPPRRPLPRRPLCTAASRIRDQRGQRRRAQLWRARAHHN